MIHHSDLKVNLQVIQSRTIPTLSYPFEREKAYNLEFKNLKEKGKE